MNLLLIVGGFILALVLFIPVVYAIAAILGGLLFVVVNIISIPYWMARGGEWLILKSWSLIRLALLRLRPNHRPDVVL